MATLAEDRIEDSCTLCPWPQSSQLIEVQAEFGESGTIASTERKCSPNGGTTSGSSPGYRSLRPGPDASRTAAGPLDYSACASATGASRPTQCWQQVVEGDGSRGGLSERGVVINEGIAEGLNELLDGFGV